MFPDIEYVMKKRYLLNMIMRGVAFLLFSIAAMWALQLIAQLILIVGYGLFSSWRNPGGLDLEDVMVVIIPAVITFVAPGAMLLAYQERLVVWIVPLPRPECPHCGYNLKELATSRCPECGCDLPKAVIQRDQESTPT